MGGMGAVAIGAMGARIGAVGHDAVLGDLDSGRNVRPETPAPTRASPSTISTSPDSQPNRCAAAPRIISRNFAAAARMAEPPITIEREL